MEATVLDVDDASALVVLRVLLVLVQDGKLRTVYYLHLIEGEAEGLSHSSSVRCLEWWQYDDGGSTTKTH